MSTELVSVLLPVRQRTEYLHEAAESILNQSYKDIEMIIIDDSAGKADDKMREINDGRIRILKGKNKGLSAALNLGIAESRGVYIARMDSDDISLKGRIESQVRHLRADRNVSLTGCNLIYADESGQEIYRKDYPALHDDIEFFMPVFTSVPHPAVLARKEVFTECSYDENVMFAEDLNLFLNMLRNGVRFSNVQEYLYRYRFYKKEKKRYISEHEKTAGESRAYLGYKSSMPENRNNPVLALQYAYTEYYKGSRKAAREYFRIYVRQGGDRKKIKRFLIASRLPDKLFRFIRNLKINTQFVFSKKIGLR